MTTTIFQRVIGIAHHSFTLEGKDSDEYTKKFQKDDLNGLCARESLNALGFVVGVQDGFVRLKIDLFPHEPRIDKGWDDIVENSILLRTNEIIVCEWAHESIYPIKCLKGNYRIRYYMRGMDNEPGDAEDFYENVGEPNEEYYIQLWKSDIEIGGALIKNESRTAKHWNTIKYGKCV